MFRIPSFFLALQSTHFTKIFRERQVKGETGLLYITDKDVKKDAFGNLLKVVYSP
jgi:hypothetical protein